MKVEWTNADSLTASQTTKAILVIDIDANELPEDAYANVYVFGTYEQEDDFVACIGDVPLKPMPQPKKITREWLEGEYENGWNDCLEEIEK